MTGLAGEVEIWVSGLALPALAPSPTYPWGFQVSIVFAWLALVGAIALGIHRSSFQEPELVRKVVHIGTGNIIVLAWWLQIPTWIGIAASILFSGLTLLSYVVPILPGINEVGRRSLGTFFYALSIGLLIAGFWPRHLPQFAVLGVLIMTWGDGLAGLIGKAWGRHRYHLWGMDKSWEGSGTMALVSFGLTAIILGSTVETLSWSLGLCAIVVAIVATVLEAFSKLGLDNLTVPLGTALLAWAMVQGLGLSPIL